MTILSAPAAVASTSQHPGSQHALAQHPLKEKRRQLQDTQARIAHIDRIRAQLEALEPRHRGRRSRRASTSSAASSWSVASTGSDGSFASELKGRELLVPLAGVAFVPATVQKGMTVTAQGETGGNDDDEDDEEGIQVAFIRSSGQANEQLVRIDAAEIGKEYREMTIEEALAYLDEKEAALEAELSHLRDEVVNMARATLMEHLGEPGASDDAATPTNEQGEALNEEGLPFVDPIEPIAEGRGEGVAAPLQPFVRDPMTKDARKYWIDTVFSQLEDEEEKSEVAPAAENTAPATPEQPPRRTTVHRRLSSAERPAPPKSVLKPTGPVPPPLPRFGSSGIRRGFLNLNPSSPAAEHSSDPVEAIKFDKAGNAIMSRSSSSSPWDREGSVYTDSNDERMSRSVELPMRETTAQKKKKTVRIKSPSREREPKQTETKRKAARVATSVRDAGDEDVEDEAKNILELLGLDAIKGHPQAAGLYEALKDSEKMKALAGRAEAARVAALEKERESQKDKKPAVGQMVMERQLKAPQNDQPGAPVKAASAFKRGFLNGSSAAKPANALPADALPTGPRISQGVSALERATKSDQGVEEHRKEQGLKPAVPHARPSKAFAQKLEAQRKGENVQGKEEEEEEEEEHGVPPLRTSKVRFGSGDNGEVTVKIGSAATPSSNAARIDNIDDQDEDDDALDAIGVHVSEEDLDEDTVEALGYFSDEDYDPDIGLDHDDIVQSQPQFNSDGAEISNDELRREYERIKAALGTHSSASEGGGGDGGDDDGDDYGQGRDMSLQSDDTVRVSRFKQDRVKRALSGQSAVSTELGTGLERAHNVGPSMLIPSIANVRFPKAGQEAVEGQPLDLDGQSDADDDDLEAIMRLRLAQREEHNLSSGPQRTPTAPPEVAPTSETVPKKKPSLFKTRLGEKESSAE